AQFRHGLRRHNDVRLMASGKLQLDVDHGQTPAIGRDKRQFVLLETEKQAVEDVTGLIGRDRVRGLAQSVAQILLPDGNDLRSLEFRQGRKLFLRQSQDLEKTLPTP